MRHAQLLYIAMDRLTQTAYTVELHEAAIDCTPSEADHQPFHHPIDRPNSRMNTPKVPTAAKMARARSNDPKVTGF